MAHTYATVFVHLVFSTKERASLIPAEKLDSLWAYIRGIARNHDITPIAVGGTSNHLHVLIQLPTTMSLSEAANKLKSNSSRWMSEHGPRFAWQEGYGAFSVSPSQVESVKEYIATQAEHHKKRNFEEEYVGLLKKCGVDYDPKYVFVSVAPTGLVGFVARAPSASALGCLDSGPPGLCPRDCGTDEINRVALI